MDWSTGSPGSRATLFLADYINNGQPSGSCGIWKSADGGTTWSIKSQSDWPRGITVDQNQPSRVYASGLRSTSMWGESTLGGWGYGGGLVSNDGGETWQMDSNNPYQPYMNAVTVDLQNPCYLWYATSAGGVLHGPAAPGLPGC